MKLTSYIFIISIILLSCKKELTPDPIQKDYFIKLYGKSFIDEGLDVKQTSDDGYIMVGKTSISDQETDLMIIKTDMYGNVEWQQNFGNQGYDEGRSVKITSDGGYIVTGVTTSTKNERKAVIIKYSTTGSKQWDQIIGADSSHYEGNSIIQLSDGGFAVAGTYSSDYFDNSISKQMLVLRLDNTGSILWEGQYGQNNNIDEGNEIIQESSGDLVLIGSTSITRNADDLGINIGIHQIDLNTGTSLRDNSYGGGTSDIGNSIHATSDGGFVMVGNSNGNIYVSRIGNDIFDVKWEKEIGSFGIENGNSIVITNDNKIIITGSINTNGKEDVYLVILGMGGSLITEETYGGSGLDVGNSASLTSDGGIVITGLSEFESNQMATIIKTDSEGLLK